MRFIALIFCATWCLSARSQTVMSTDTIGSHSGKDVYIRPLSGDSLSSGFCIVIKTEVKPHKHLTHSEQVLVTEGEGMMSIDGKSFSIAKNDVIFIPKGKVHSVKSTGNIPLKVISIQAPLFDGSDRVMVKD